MVAVLVVKGFGIVRFWFTWDGGLEDSIRFESSFFVEIGMVCMVTYPMDSLLEAIAMTALDPYLLIDRVESFFPFLSVIPLGLSGYSKL